MECSRCSASRSSSLNAQESSLNSMPSSDSLSEASTSGSVTRGRHHAILSDIESEVSSRTGSPIVRTKEISVKSRKGQPKRELRGYLSRSIKQSANIYDIDAEQVGAETSQTYHSPPLPHWYSKEE
ncbi:hypothetical protein O6H91_13G036200 [Diphasiastrum complanatum]|uniref:Uncharacterized protein n=1 Tax=Diphasiastrum complanatum TaxID=34168 RepID=A0ACC2BTR1_DIPCM|nr:hypothetical protein O6H91_13G036200 [Diphasiastrum complanatum]